MTGWVVGRAFALAALAAVGIAAAGPRPDAGTALAVMLLAAASFAVLLWHLPVAMLVGGATPGVGERGTG